MQKIGRLSLELKRQPVQLGPIVRAALLQTDRAADAKRVSFSVQIDAAIDSDWLYVSDDARILQVFSSLVSSAVTFTRRNSTVTIRLFILPSGAGVDGVATRVRFEVTDMSTEIDPDLQV